MFGHVTFETHADWSSLTGPSRTTWTFSFPSEWLWIMVWIDVWNATVEPRYIVLLHVLNYFKGNGASHVFKGRE